MARIIKVRLTEYYPFQSGMTRKQKRMEGGILDRKGKPLYSLEDFVEGKAPYVSLACDTLGGAPAKEEKFKIYGTFVWLPRLGENINNYLPKPLAFVGLLPQIIPFKLVDTGGNFRGEKKQIIVSGYEPIDVCRRQKPAKEFSFSTMLTEMVVL